jgi:hypothetical protein
MTNDISMRPAYLGDSAIPGAFADNRGLGRPPRIAPDSGFKVLDENGDVVKPAAIDLQVIMLYENDTRIYYPKGSYDPDNPAPPACFSDDKIRPSEYATQPQSELCADCPRAVWDQPTPRGNLVPACDNRYKVACLVAGVGPKLFLLSVPPASRRPYEQYVRFLKSHHAQPSDVITRLTYADKILGFNFEGWVSEKTAGFIKEIALSDEPKMLVGKIDGPKPIVLPKPVQQAAVGADFQPPQRAAANLAPALPAEEKNQPLHKGPVAAEEAARRGRPRKETVIPPGPTRDLFGDVPASPAATSMTRARAAPSPKDDGQGFGMEPPKSPPQNIQEALDAAFGAR